MCIYARTHICWSHSANSHSCLSDVFVSLMLRIAAKIWNISIIPTPCSKQTHRDSIFILLLFCFAVDFCLPKKFIRSQTRDKKKKKKKRWNEFAWCLHYVLSVDGRAFIAWHTNSHCCFLRQTNWIPRGRTRTLCKHFLTRDMIETEWKYRCIASTIGVATHFESIE